jgi:hypothetical protein
MTGKLVVLQSRDGTDEVDDESPFVINEVFEGLPVDPFDEAYESIATFELEPIAGVPIFDMVWPKFASSFNEYATDPSGLAHLIILYNELETRVSNEGITELECRGVDGYYLSLLADFAENEGIRMSSDGQPPKRPGLTGFLQTLGRLCLVLIDHFLSLVLKYLFDDVTRPTDVVFVPHLNRFESMEPVIRAATYPYRVVAPVTTLDWIRPSRIRKWQKIEKYDPIPISCFITPTILMREIVFVGRLIIDELLLGRFKRQLAMAVQAEFDIQLNRSITHALNHVYRTHFTAIPNLFLARRMCEVTGCKSVVVGALSLRQQAFLFAAAEHNISAFHVPHTVSLRQEQVPKTNATHLVASPIAERYLREEWYVPDEASVVALGRPRLSAIAGDRPDFVPPGEPLKFVIATQPFEDAVRRSFVSSVLQGAANLDTDVDIVIKIHPNEDIDFYQPIAADSDLDVVVTADNLQRHLCWADLTFVINTNVGMESMILGTPCVSINRWSPRTPIRPYQSAGPIPVLDTEERIHAFFDGLDEEAIISLRREQINYVDENYVPSEDIDQQIAAFVNPA